MGEATTVTLELTQDELDAISIALGAGPPRPSPGRDWTAAWRSAREKVLSASYPEAANASVEDVIRELRSNP